jgi:hypothetical protein
VFGWASSHNQCKYMGVFSLTDRNQSAIFLFHLLLSTRRRCRGLFLHVIKFNHTHIQSVGLLLAKDRPSHRPLSAQHTTFTIDKYPCTPAGFEIAIPAAQWLQTYALECRATKIGVRKFESINFAVNLIPQHATSSVNKVVNALLYPFDKNVYLYNCLLELFHFAQSHLPKTSLDLHSTSSKYKYSRPTAGMQRTKPNDWNR